MLQVLEELELTMDQFIDLCILCGCDYCDSIKGILINSVSYYAPQFVCISEMFYLVPLFYLILYLCLFIRYRGANSSEAYSSTWVHRKHFGES